jgi:cytochrome c553
MKATLLLVLSLITGTATAADSAQLQRGQYLVELLSCAACHTDGQLVNDPNGERYLAGSGIGIAYSNHDQPGVVFPSNLTPDSETGIGRWTPEQITRNIQYGIDKHGRQQLPVMPWPGYAHMAEDDAQAITAYLLSLPAVKHRVPENVAPNSPSTSPYVRYGVYLFYPEKPAGQRLDARPRAH